MTKPFNIHDWQAKQRLAEQRADWTPPPMGMSPEEMNSQGDIFGRGPAYQELDSGIQYYIDEFIKDIEEGNKKDGTEYLNDLIKAIVALRDSATYEDDSERDFLPLQEHTVTFTKDDMATLHNDGELIKADDDGKDHTYIFNELDEQNTVGTGASFSPGNSPAYATPKAFGKKKDKDIEVFGYKKVKK